MSECEHSVILHTLWNSYKSDELWECRPLTAGALPRLALRVRNRISPAGGLLANLCLATGYIAFASALATPDILHTALSTVPDGVALPVAYLVTFAYPAAYALISLVAAVAASSELSEWTPTSHRDRVHVYLSVAFAEWTIHHLLYLLFPLTLLWGMISLSMGITYAISVWGMLCVAAVGILVGNRYLWYHDPDDLPVEGGCNE